MRGQLTSHRVLFCYNELMHEMHHLNREKGGFTLVVRIATGKRRRGKSRRKTVYIPLGIDSIFDLYLVSGSIS